MLAQLVIAAISMGLNWIGGERMIRIIPASDVLLLPVLGRARRLCWREGLLLAALLLTGCDARGPMQHTPEELFQTLIVDSIPWGVAELQGAGMISTGGYRAYLKFRASRRFMDEYLGTGYRRVGWEVLALYFEYKDGDFAGRLSFWDPETVTDKECYESTGMIRNAWTNYAQHFFLIDRSTGYVYFYGAGG